jgi:large subunit ribosomal protein L10
MRTSKTFQIKGGVLQGRVIGEEGIKALADLPSREQLLARVVGGFQAPLAGLVNVLAGNIRNLAYVIEAIRKQKEAAA